MMMRLIISSSPAEPPSRDQSKTWTNFLGPLSRREPNACPRPINQIANARKAPLASGLMTLSGGASGDGKLPNQRLGEPADDLSLHRASL